MKLRRLSGGDDDCENGTCPTVYLTDAGDLVVQGFVVEDAEALGTMQLPAGETAVRVPAELIRKVARDHLA